MKYNKCSRENPRNNWQDWQTDLLTKEHSLALPLHTQAVHRQGVLLGSSISVSDHQKIFSVPWGGSPSIWLTLVHQGSLGNLSLIVIWLQPCLLCFDTVVRLWQGHVDCKKNEYWYSGDNDLMGDLHILQSHVDCTSIPSSSLSKVQNGLAIWYQLTLVVLEYRPPLNEVLCVVWL